MTEIKDNCVFIELEELVIAFIGLPSAGKSTLINSITGKRFLKSGVCRTTLKPAHVIGKQNIFNLPEEDYNMENLESDDNIEYTVIDLPGLADSENKSNETNFDKLTLEWIKKADVIFWVSDINICFITRS
jgi:GTPase Era involved in 16S rRNA processing